MTHTRLIAETDASFLTHLAIVNRAFLAPWDPIRDDSYYTYDGQLRLVQDALQNHQQGVSLPHVILDEGGSVVGRINLNGIVRGPFLSCSLGYWVNFADNGRGLACAAVAEIKEIAFDALGLHRIQAETLLNNAASQRVLDRNNFVRFAVAPEYLNIAGRWQDHILFQALAPTTLS